jgi:hypothetical protein
LNEFESNKENKDYKKKYVKIYSIMLNKNKKISWLESPSLFIASFHCNFYILNKYKLNENSYYSNYNFLLKQFLKEGTMDNWILNHKLLKETPAKEFSNIIYRAPILTIIFAHIAFDKV